jgi:hypothetical protein
MFVGHYAAALAAKAAEPRAPLWALVGGCQLLDIGWSGLVMAGVEKLRIDPSLPGSNLDLYYMPFTHGLPAALAWSVGAGLIARVARLPWAASAMIGASVFSHWLLDFLVHRPDLELLPHGAKVGLAFWNYPLPEMALELGLVGMAGAALVASRKDQGRSAWPIVAFMAVLTGVQMIASYMSQAGGGGDPAGFGLQALIVYLAVTAIAWLVDRNPGKTSGGGYAVA